MNKLSAHVDSQSWCKRISFWLALDGGEFHKLGLDVNALSISGGMESVQAWIMERENAENQRNL